MQSCYICKCYPFDAIRMKILMDFRKLPNITGMSLEKQSIPVGVKLGGLQVFLKTTKLAMLKSSSQAFPVR